MRLGARILKTGIAVALSLYLSTWLGLGTPVFAAIAAILTIQPSLYRSWQHVFEQLQANVLGAIIAISAGYTLGNDHIIIGLVVILVIMINIKLGFEKTIALTMVTVLALMVGTDNISFITTINRFSLILVGIFSSMVINILFLPPKYEARLSEAITETTNQIMQLFPVIFDQNLEKKEFRRDKKQIREELRKIDEVYVLYREERTYLKKVKYTKTRKLIVFKQMISTCLKAFETLETVEYHIHSTDSLFKDHNVLHSMIAHQLNILTNYHYKIMSKYEGKIKVHPLDDRLDEANNQNDALIEELIKQYHQADISSTIKQNHWQHYFSMVAMLSEYSNQLLRLDRLVNNYHSRHSEPHKNKTSASL